jgi:hypothetical protein
MSQFKCLKVKKCKIKSLLREEFVIPINNCILSINTTVINAYALLRLYLVECITLSVKFPIITQNFIKRCLVVVSENDNITHVCDIDTTLHQCIKRKFVEFTRVNVTNMSQLLNSEATDILKNIENNVSFNFRKMIVKYIRLKYNRKICIKKSTNLNID